MLPDDKRNQLLDIGQGKLLANKIIERLTPFVEELQTTGSVLLERKLKQHSVLMNKIYNDIIETGLANQQEVIELRLILKDLKEIYGDLKNYSDAKKITGSNG